jgi:NADH dehydrogenase
MPVQSVTVFGGTGFLGRRIVRHLHDAGFAVRIASRHPDRGLSIVSSASARITSIYGDINDDASVAAVVHGVFAVVNAVSLYVEREGATFQSVHVGAAERAARLAHQAGVERLVHISGIGADAQSTSPYIRSRGQGEDAVLKAFPTAQVLRPAVMFGPGDAFMMPLLAMLRRMPVFPMFGGGETKLQPAYVKDVGEASVRLLKSPSAHRIYELAGPRIYSYRALLTALAASAGSGPVLVPMPFALWHALGYLGEFLPSPPITRNQVELMEADSVAASDAPGFEALQIQPREMEDILPKLLGA